MSKSELLAWAYSIINNHVKSDSFGNITISMASGKISSVKCDMNHKPPLDDNIKNK